MADSALVIMARYPEPGKTKTRLARSLLQYPQNGSEKEYHSASASAQAGYQTVPEASSDFALNHVAVAELYRAFLQDLALRFSNQPYQLYWAYTPAEADYPSLLRTLAPDRQMACFPQEGDGFGERLLHAFRSTYLHGIAETILIGSDSPHLGRELVEQARQELQEADVVLGPAEDGGYYLVAMHQPHDIFSNVPMSSSVTLAMTLQACQQQRLRTRLLPPAFDIDELPELHRLAQLLQHNPALAPATAQYLQTLLRRSA